MNPELIRRLGEFSTMLLASAEFNDLFTLFEQQVAVDVLGTKPDDSKERERLYATLQGSRGFMTHVAQFANDYALLQQPDAEPVQDHDDPDVHDISYESL